MANDILLSAKMYIFSLEPKEELFWHIKIKKNNIKENINKIKNNSNILILKPF